MINDQHAKYFSFELRSQQAIDGSMAETFANVYMSRPRDDCRSTLPRVEHHLSNNDGYRMNHHHFRTFALA